MGLHTGAAKPSVVSVDLDTDEVEDLGAEEYSMLEVDVERSPQDGT